MEKYLKRYLRFSYGCYYPEGGMNDFTNDFDSLKELLEDSKNIFIPDSSSIESIYDCKKRCEIFRTYNNKVYFPLEDDTRGIAFNHKDEIIKKLCKDY